ncbi:MAG: hypothetical protein EPO68_06020 [Planctomycetota bacterium]|nr:MAG: hypothetical protein EPO68_06020 [Planctomycetota bacterium]
MNGCNVRIACSGIGLAVCSWTAAFAQCELHRVWSPVEATRYFGASISIDGARAIVGAPGGGAANEVGYVSFLREEPSGWAVESVHFDPSSASGAEFGASVDLDGELAVVGALAANAPYGHSGAVHCFVRSGDAWVLEATLLSPSASSSGYFGTQVSMSGAWLLIGAPGEPEPMSGPPNFGRVHAYRRVANAWVHDHALAPPTSLLPSHATSMGRSLAHAGAHALVQLTLSPSQKVSVVAYDRVGDVWTPIQLLPETLDGINVGLAVDGGRAGVVTRSLARVYEFGLGSWSKTASLATPPSFESEARSVALEGDALVVGCPRFDLPTFSSELQDAGCVAIYRKGGGTWSLMNTYTACDAVEGDRFGSAVALRGDLLLAGVERAEAPGRAANQDSGAVQALDLVSSACPTLVAEPSAISAAAGGYQEFRMQPGSAQAHRYMLIAATASGTSPGIVLDGWPVPLNPDTLTRVVLSALNTEPYTANFSKLGADGQGYASLSFPVGAASPLVGLTVHHAAVVIDLVNKLVTFASNAAPLSITP